ncbi:adenosine deaminase [Fluviispira multicolorata]|uniref:Adenine deaminase n=1 Tax=Fluviispira multicolorata TaxID=2654512 RepID=A0A833JF51_9BACT|nr:adenosine deaminase [Fluviispira multicolorata]KAB8033556.1 adenosine deaminase [Fluviispira multicolorata]
MQISQLIKLLPKAELHLHIEGTLEPELMFELAQRNNIQLPYANIEEVRKSYEFHDLQSFLDVYYLGASVLIKKQDFFDLTYAYLEKANEDGIKHVEIFFDPQTHTQRGVSFEDIITGIVEALNKAKDEFAISSFLIMSFLRHLSEEDAFEVLEQAKPFYNNIKAIGLDSAEIGNPPEKFKNVFKKAIDLGFLTVAHAGEEGPAENIRNSLDLLNVKRIDHGVNCVTDESLLQELIKQKTPLTVCPLSNVKLKVFKHMSEHNIRDLYLKGVCVTINSDDPSYFGGYLADNYIECQKHLNFSFLELVQIAKNSFQASFLTEEEKEIRCKEIDKFCQNLADMYGI